MTQPLLIATLDSDMAPVTEGAVVGVELSDTTKGTISEKLFEVGALRRGWFVASNTGGGNDFDSVIKRAHMPVCVVVQTRSATPYPKQFGCYQFSLSTCGSLYAPTAFHVLAIHLPDTDEFVFFTRAEMGNRKGSSYTRPEHRKFAPRHTAMASRDPNNWNLLDEVAESLTQTQ